MSPRPQITNTTSRPLFPVLPTAHPNPQIPVPFLLRQIQSAHLDQRLQEARRHPEHRVILTYRESNLPTYREPYLPTYRQSNGPTNHGQGRRRKAAHLAAGDPGET